MPKSKKEIKYIETDSDSDKDSVSDNESVHADSDNESVHADSDNESVHADSDNEDSSVVKTTNQKGKKQQVNFKDLLGSKELLVKERDELLENINEQLKELQKNQTAVKKLNRKISSIDKNSEKVYNRDIKIAKKEKRKRTKKIQVVLIEKKKFQIF